MVSFKKIEDIFVFDIAWEIDETNADNAFKYIFDNFFWNKIIYDLSKLEYWNSKFLWYLSSMNEFIEEKDWKMVILKPTTRLADTLYMAWINKIISIVDSIDAALLLF